MYFSVKLSLFVIFCVVSCAKGSDENPRVAIIGAGIGGTSASYFLRQLFGANVEIDIFEKQQVGGRLAPVTISGHDYNAGGAILHPSNMYMWNFTELLGLERDLSPESGTLGIYDGEEILVTTSDYTAVTLAKLFWRYGMDIYNIQNWVRDNVLKHMDRLYEIQKEGHAFSTVEDLLNAMDPSLVEWSKMSTQALMKQEGFSDRFIDEFVQATMRAVYGQTTEAHGCVGATSVIGGLNELWNVVGGNHQVPNGLLQKSGANLIHGEVTTISLVGEGSPPVYQVDYLPAKSKNEDDVNSKEYDIVIIAAPIYKGMSDIKFEDFQRDILPVDNDFHLTVQAFIEGKVNTSYFGFDNEASFPKQIFTSNERTFCTNLIKLDTPAEKTPVYKIVSNEVPTMDQLKQFVPEWTDLRLVEWKAYPKYPSTVNFPSFTLHEQMYHINAIEMASSAMEMSSIGAKNVALLAYYRYTGQYDKIDEIMTTTEDHEKKSEL